MSGQDIVEDIKAKLDIVTVVSEYVELRKSGRSFKALCPFHKESSPSFIISPDKQIAYCFGCQKGGDIFKFVMEVERLDFPEAVKFLAWKAGIEYQPQKISSIKKSDKERWFEIMHTATEFYQEQLQNSPEAKEYLLKRGLNEQTITDFKIGFAPNSYDDLWRELREKHRYETEELLKVGLLALNDAKHYNKFRGRIMFPITNHLGDIVAFGGRILGDGEPKYLNSPETPIYHKSNVLYGLSFAKDAIREAGSVIIVEGYMDVLSAWQAGIHNIVASSGTAFTKEQVQLLKRHTSTFYFLFDNDNAGWQATLRNAEVVIPQDIEVRPISLKAHNVKDVDEFFQKYSKDELLKLTEDAKPFHDFVLAHLLSKFDPETIEGKKRIVTLYLPLVKLLTSQIAQEHYLKQVAYQMMSTVEAVTKEFKKIKTPKIHENVSAELFNQTHFSTPEAIFTGILIAYPELYSEIHDHLYLDELDGELPNHVYKLIKNEYTFSGDISQIHTLLHDDVKTRVEVLLLYLDEANITHNIDIARTTLKEKLILLQHKLKDKLLLKLAYYQKEKNTEGMIKTGEQLSQLRNTIHSPFTS
ncbi:MAG: DNA primase [Candidatus Gracilibacteria bacterium]